MLSWTIYEVLSLLYVLPKVKRVNSKQYKEVKEKRISYGEHDDQYLLLFEPKERVVKNNFIFYLHGGGWRFNSPQMYRFTGIYLAQQGYVTISAGYRYLPDYQYPAQIEDAFNGFEKACSIINNKYSPNKDTVIMGTSSGAHLGSILVYDQSRQAEFEIEQDRIKGFISYSGPLNFNACNNRVMQKMINNFMGNAKDFKSADPMQIIKSREQIPKIPVLCIHGDKDPLVSYENSQSVVNYINDKSGEQVAELFTAEGKHHTDLSVDLFLKDIEARKKFKNWLEKRE